MMEANFNQIYYFVVLLAVLAIPHSIPAAELPTALNCSSNAKAWRDYGFREKQWGGTIPPKPSKPFGIVTRPKPIEGYPLWDKVFSALDTQHPVIRSITPASDCAEEQAVEFKGTVVSRTENTVFMIWTNDGGHGNKAWLAAIDLLHRKATISQLFGGVTSIGGEIETLDCH